jgi:cytochrome c oxidase subunit 3
MSEIVNQQQAAVAAVGTTASELRDPHHHPAHLAHHFNTPEQQYNSAKVGMWVFLATEMLMFGGLFCAYSVYRHNHPEVFDFAHHELERNLGAINTAVLLISSFTMALGVRAAQLGQRKLLTTCLVLTLLGGGGFMIIKSMEYHHHYENHLWIGSGNLFSKIYHPPEEKAGPSGGLGTENAVPITSEEPSSLKPKEPAEPVYREEPVGVPYVDPHQGTADQAKIVPPQKIPSGMALTVTAPPPEKLNYNDLSQLDKDRVSVFFNIYYLMTGLHAIHVIVGMSLIFWVLIRNQAHNVRLAWSAFGPFVVGGYFVWLGFLTGASWLWIWVGIFFALMAVLLIAGGIRARRPSTGSGDFGPIYYTPVDLVGLYWHLVDLIWIFLFPLLYLIH